jgi:hypothetical protein
VVNGRHVRRQLTRILGAHGGARRSTELRARRVRGLLAVRSPRVWLPELECRRARRPRRLRCRRVGRLARSLLIKCSGARSVCRSSSSSRRARQCSDARGSLMYGPIVTHSKNSWRRWVGQPRPACAPSMPASAMRPTRRSEHSYFKATRARLTEVSSSTRRMVSVPRPARSGRPLGARFERHHPLDVCSNDGQHARSRPTGAPKVE